MYISALLVWSFQSYYLHCICLYYSNSSNTFHLTSVEPGEAPS